MWTLWNNVTNFPFHPLRQLFLVLKSLCFKWSSGPPHNFSSLSKVGPNLNLMDWKTTFTLQTKLTELRQEKYRNPTLYWLEFVYFVLICLFLPNIIFKYNKKNHRNGWGVSGRASISYWLSHTEGDISSLDFWDFEEKSLVKYLSSLPSQINSIKKVNISRPPFQVPWIQGYFCPNIFHVLTLPLQNSYFSYGTYYCSQPTLHINLTDKNMSYIIHIRKHFGK